MAPSDFSPSPVRLTRLRAKNFRSLADVTVSLEPLTIVVGPNASGKSNLLDALRFMRDALTTRLHQAVDGRGGMSALRRWSPKGRPYDVTLEVNLESAKWEATYAFTLGSERRGEFRVKRERCEVKTSPFDAPLVFALEDGRWTQRPSVYPAVEDLMKDLPSATADALWDEVQQVPTGELFLPRAALLLGSPFFAAVWNALHNTGFYNLYPNAFREPAKSANPYPLQDDGTNLTSTLRALRREHRDVHARIVQFLRAAVPGVDDVSVKQVGSYLVTQIHRGILSSPQERQNRRAAFDLAQESDGTLRLLALFTALFQQPARTLVGIEEPELNVHPGALAVLGDAMRLASRNTQILVTSHSPELLAEFPPEVFRIVEMVDGATRVGGMAEHQREAIRERLFTPGELLVMEGLQREELHA